MAVIVALRALKNPGQQVLIFSDSKYVVDAVDKGWVFGWVQKGFKDKKNKDLWLQYLQLHKLHQIKFKWIKGHNEHPENERCDRLAVAASQDKVNWAIDTVFEAERNNTPNLLP